ncbi:MAG: hypothetical protein GKS00_18550 [Alphaproteobacteria bacterium]|nr:hypothetical protein [Alphaproteobacteria bacterium]
MIPAHIAIAVLVIAYPIIVYFGLEFFEARLIAFALVAIALLRLFLSRRFDGLAARMPQANLVVAALLLVGVSAMAFNSPTLLQYYPVCMNVLMFTLFLVSLVRPPSIIEQIARITTPDLPEAGISYTRKVTMVWCAFFIVNGAIALYTVLGTNMAFWALYNSVISYSLMGILFAGEYAVRRAVQRSTARHQGAKGWF